MISKGLVVRVLCNGKESVLLLPKVPSPKLLAWQL